jgi:hypothetical protein
MAFTTLPMLSAHWQTVVALICVATALLYLACRLLRAVVSPSSSACSRCTQTPITGVKQIPLVTLESLSKSADPPPREF